MSAIPWAVVGEEGAQALRAGAWWCSRQDVASGLDGLAPGAVVQVLDERRRCLGQALAAQRSPIALRLLSRRPPSEVVIDDAFFARRMAEAIARRDALGVRDAVRLVHGEADLLPGLFVDRYGDALCLQTLSEGADVRKARWAQALAELTGARLVVGRDDASGRDFEGLAREKGVLVGGGSPKVAYHEGANRFEVDLLHDSKTGGFLDQVDNHLRAGVLASGVALDTFSYHGGFALALAERCRHVTAVEQDDQAIARLRANVAENQRSAVEVQHANAFDVLREAARAGPTFDVVVVDPPGLAKRREGLDTALRAYHELNLRALQALRPGGLLVSCSCSGRLDRARFETMLVGAARDARRTIQILERRGAGIDHPVLVGLPESEYLKAYFVRVLDGDEAARVKEAPSAPREQALGPRGPARGAGARRGRSTARARPGR